MYLVLILLTVNRSGLRASAKCLNCKLCYRIITVGPSVCYISNTQVRSLYRQLLNYKYLLTIVTHTIILVFLFPCALACYRHQRHPAWRRKRKWQLRLTSQVLKHHAPFHSPRSGSSVLFKE